MKGKCGRKEKGKGEKIQNEERLREIWWKISGIYPIGKNMENDECIRHERGHQIQSFILGPLYLLIIGLPSIIWCRCFENYRKTNDISYYSFYTEKWANKLGKVDE